VSPNNAPKVPALAATRRPETLVSRPESNGVDCQVTRPDPAGQGHESALHFRAYAGKIAVNTPMSDTRPRGRPEPGPDRQ